MLLFELIFLLLRLLCISEQLAGGPYLNFLLSVLKSHFNRACIGLFKQLYRLCERRFVRTFDLQKGFSFSEAVNDGSGKEMVWVPKI